MHSAAVFDDAIGKGIKRWSEGNSKEVVLIETVENVRPLYLGRFNLYGYICFLISVFLGVLVIVLIPVFYFAVIPNQIRNEFSNSAMDKRNPVFSSGRNGNNFLLVLDNSKKFFIPGTGSIVGPTTFEFLDKKDSPSPFGKVVIQDVNVPLHQDSRPEIDGNFTLVSIPSFFPTQMIYFRASCNIKAYGITWYRDFKIQAEHNLNSVTGWRFFSFIHVFYRDLS